ncbi:MAG: PP2C family protein-serine/threonine phosphatase [Bacteroidota bacterium]|nr:PP2C family protein-serine/threonine phosphatase [Bacteroidota bacterium]
MTTPSHTSRSESELVALFEFSQVVNSSLDLSFILDTMLLTLMGKLLTTKGVVLLRKEHKTFFTANGKGIPKSLLDKEIELVRVGKKTIHVDKEFSEILSSHGINILFPIISQDQVIGYFGAAEHPQRKISKEQNIFAETLISLSATAIEKGLSFSEVKKVNRSLDEKIQQLKTLFELAKEFGGILNPEIVVKLFSLTLMGQVGTSRYAICLKEGKSHYSKISGEYLESDKQTMFRLVSIPMLVSEISEKKKYKTLYEHLVKEKIAALIPLQMQNEVKGVLCLGDKLRGGGYTESDLEFIFSLSNLAFVSLENARLFNEELEKKKMESELMIAREIQQGLLPQILPIINGFEIAAENISSKQVGGDYYDVIPSDNGKFIITIADVSGKGTPASLLMANVQATVHALVPFQLALSVATARINDLIFRNTSSDKFITFFWGSLDPQTKNFQYVNAGHNPPFVLRRDGTIERLSDGGLILGVMKTIMPYQEGSVQLNSGDSVVLFTDGVSEAMDTNGVDYTEERLETFVKGLNGTPASTMLSEIKNEIQRYSSGAAQSDDITLIVFKAI